MARAFLGVLARWILPHLQSSPHGEHQKNAQIFKHCRWMITISYIYPTFTRIMHPPQLQYNIIYIHIYTSVARNMGLVARWAEQHSVDSPQKKWTCSNTSAFTSMILDGSWSLEMLMVPAVWDFHLNAFSVPSFEPFRSCPARQPGATGRPSPCNGTSAGWSHGPPGCEDLQSCSPPESPSCAPVRETGIKYARYIVSLYLYIHIQCWCFFVKIHLLILLLNFTWTKHAIHWWPGEWWVVHTLDQSRFVEGTTSATGLVLDLVLNLSMRSKYCSLSNLLETLTAKPKQGAITRESEVVSTDTSMKV